MKQATRHFISAAAFLFSASCAVDDHQHAVTMASNEQGRDLIPHTTIVYTSNVNGELEPCGCRSNPVGGLPRKWNFFKSENIMPPAAGQSKPLILDSGDLLYPSNASPPFLKAQWDAQAEALLESYNEMGCDGFAPGEMDFASGLEMFEILRKKAKFPFLSANIHRQQTGELLLPPFTIVERDGIKVALFGLYDESLELPGELNASPHLDAARELVPRLRKKAQVVIALTHLGIEKDQDLARQVTGIDAIFGGHSQSFLQDPMRIGETIIFQTSFRNQHIGIYKSGINKLVALEPNYDSSPVPRSNNPMWALIDRTKAKVAEINKKNEAELLSSTTRVETTHPTFQTFVKCVDCHTPQYDFYKKTRHAGAYAALVNKKQNFNKDCLACHTLGMNQASGWRKVTDLVFTATGKAVPPDSFASSLPQMNASSLARYSKAYVNVQCEHCHGPAGEHPWSGSYAKNVKVDTCVKCHTPTQAPDWYKNGKLDAPLVENKKKSISCPRTKN